MSLLVDISIVADSIVKAAWERATANRERLRLRQDLQAVREATDKRLRRQPGWEEAFTNPPISNYRPDEPVALPLNFVVVTLAVSPESVPETSSAGLVFTFTRSGPTSEPLAVRFTVAGTATDGLDYSSDITGEDDIKTVEFLAGSSTATITVIPTTDLLDEGDETVELRLVSGTGYRVGTTDPVVGTITNVAPVYEPYNPPQDGGTGVFTLPIGIYTIRTFTYNWRSLEDTGETSSLTTEVITTSSVNSVRWSEIFTDSFTNELGGISTVSGRSLVFSLDGSPRTFVDDSRQTSSTPEAGVVSITVRGISSIESEDGTPVDIPGLVPPPDLFPD